MQSGNGTVYLSWNPSVGTTGYNILRSLDNVTYSQIANQTSTQYYDNSASTGVQYYYKVTAGNASGTSSPTGAQTVTCVTYGQASLGGLRLAAQQRSDMVNNEFVTTQEWNSYINLSIKELFDILVQVYGDEYYVAAPYRFTTDGRVPALYPLPQNIYKLLGVDLGINQNDNSYATMRKFMFQNRNKYIYANTPVGYYGYLNLQYRMLGDNIELIPNPASGQTIQLWYVPKPRTLLADSDIVDCISGWEEYILIDAAIKALEKEESDVSVLLAQKEALRIRITAASSNRDAGMPEVVTDVRNYGGLSGPFGGYGPWEGWGNGF